MQRHFYRFRPIRWGTLLIAANDALIERARCCPSDDGPTMQLASLFWVRLVDVFDVGIRTVENRRRP